jgi:hypothetical protein
MRSVCFVVAALVLVTLAGPARAQTGYSAQPAGGFTQTLSMQDQTTVGLAKLSSEELTVLNACVAREVALARAGHVRAFAGTFTGRRPAAERIAAGLDRLTPEEQARLDALVALALAAGPVRPDSASALAKDAMDIVHRLQIHGEVSLTVGSSGNGRNFYGTSLYTAITDPETNLTIELGWEQFKGNGWFGYGYGPYDYAYPDFGFRGRDFSGGGCIRRY